MKKVLVTGADGFIGSHLVDLLLKKKFAVRVIDNFSGGRKKNLSLHTKNPDLKIINKDITNLNGNEKFFENVDYIFHFAGKGDIVPSIENPEDYLTFFMKIDNAKFKQKVIPGDTLIFHLQLISPIRRVLCHMHGKGFVNNKIVVEADLLSQISPKNK